MKNSFLFHLKQGDRKYFAAVPDNRIDLYDAETFEKVQETIIYDDYNGYPEKIFQTAGGLLVLTK